MKKLLVFGVILLFFGVACSSSIIANESKKKNIQLTKGNTLYVGGSGPNNYTRIKDAVDDAVDGDTVFVYSGIYYEALNINSRISLLGENCHTTIIHKNESMWPVHCIVIHSSGVKIKGFTIENTIGGYDCSGIKITCHPNTVDNISDIIISDNIFRNNSNGIIIQELFSNLVQISNINISNNVIRDALFDDCAAIYIGAYYESGGVDEGPFNITISNNKIINSNEGIFFGECKDLTISNNVMKSTDRGIGLLDCKDITVTNNLIESNYIGINIFIVENLIITHNTIKSNSKGLVILDDYTNDSSPNISIFENNFLQNKRAATFDLPQVASLENLRSQIIWENNYWDRSRLFPKIIIGKLERLTRFYNIFIRRGFFIDWNPASEPYDMGG